MKNYGTSLMYKMKVRKDALTNLLLAVIPRKASSTTDRIVADVEVEAVDKVSKYLRCFSAV